MFECSNTITCIKVATSHTKEGLVHKIGPQRRLPNISTKLKKTIVDSYQLIPGSSWANARFSLTPMALERLIICSQPLMHFEIQEVPAFKGRPLLKVFLFQELDGDRFKYNHGSEIDLPIVGIRMVLIIYIKRSQSKRASNLAASYFADEISGSRSLRSRSITRSKMS